MKMADFTCLASDGKNLYVHKWLPDADARGVLVIAHGMAEHALRYEEFARRLTNEGWVVYAPDHRGHGKTADEGELGWICEKEGFRRVVDDLREVAAGARLAYAGLPVLLFGHCLGSLLILAHAGLYGREVDGCVLTGIIDEPSGLEIGAGRLLSALGCLVNGQMKGAALMDSMALKSKNRGFEPAQTAFEWLSRDRGEVDAFAADPLCGFICSYGFFRDLFAGFDLVFGASGVLPRIPPSLRFLVAAGDEDPMGGARGAVAKLADRLRSAGIANVDTRLYPGARHELLKELNREEVMTDVLDWIGAIAAPGRAGADRIPCRAGAAGKQGDADLE
jgi:alpha-beta hydrolase superfamily lysophospholipase